MRTSGHEKLAMMNTMQARHAAANTSAKATKAPRKEKPAPKVARGMKLQKGPAQKARTQQAAKTQKARPEGKLDPQVSRKRNATQHAPTAGAPRGSWNAVRLKLLGFQRISFVAGDAIERKFFYTFGRMMSQSQGGMSFGKWPAATAIVAAVAAGKLSFDTKLSDTFSWVSKDASDKRSRITLRHLLTFTSGYFVSKFAPADYSHANHIDCLNPHAYRVYTLELCARQIYMLASHTDEPGTAFHYNSYHMQLALAMACKKANMKPGAFLQKYLYGPANMTNTNFGSDSNPVPAFSISSTMDDLDSFLRSHLGYRIIPKRYAQTMDTEYLQANKVRILSGRSVKWEMDSRFAMGHVAARGYKLNDVTGPYVPMTADIQEWGGSSGWLAMIDRTTGVYIGMFSHGANKAINPITFVMKDVYAAMGFEFPRDHTKEGGLVVKALF